ncbi:hypothetical protein Tco_0391334, partial [Tanacetum coccineum]
VVEMLVISILVEESLRFDELLVNDMLADERVFHKIVVADEVYRVDEQLGRAVVDIVMDCTENNGC